MAVDLNYDMYDCETPRLCTERIFRELATLPSRSDRCGDLVGQELGNINQGKSSTGSGHGYQL